MAPVALPVALTAVVSVVVVAVASAAAVSSAVPDCAGVDDMLRPKWETMCAGYGLHDTTWCAAPRNVSASHDWPRQSTYTHEVLKALSGVPAECLKPGRYARQVADALEQKQTSSKIGGTWGYNWEVFQPGYFDMPRKPGVRIESAFTLGTKCWATAYLRHKWRPEPFVQAMRAASVPINAILKLIDTATPRNMLLCNEVIANCFVNASYDPARNGTCPIKVKEFETGFEWENVRNLVAIPFPFNAPGLLNL